MTRPAKYTIGASQWNGLSKLVEEAGEVIQVAGKIMGTDGDDEHWDGSKLPARLVDELGDLDAAIRFVLEKNKDRLPRDRFRAQSRLKLAKFRAWHKAQK